MAHFLGGLAIFVIGGRARFFCPRIVELAIARIGEHVQVIRFDHKVRAQGRDARQNTLPVKCNTHVSRARRQLDP